MGTKGDRRGFFQFAAAGAGLAAGGRERARHISPAVAAQRSETMPDLVPQPSPTFDASLNAANVQMMKLSADKRSMGIRAPARARGADAFRCEWPEEERPAVSASLRSPKAALVEAVVDTNGKPTRPDELHI
jgi:hypothetical protein